MGHIIKNGTIERPNTFVGTSGQTFRNIFRNTGLSRIIRDVWPPKSVINKKKFKKTM